MKTTLVLSRLLKASASKNFHFRERHEGWLKECDQKISDIKRSIEKLDSWIREGEIKLKSFPAKIKSQSYKF